MPSTFSPNLRLELIADGEQTNVWGQTTNRNLGTLLEESIAGVSTISLSGSGAYTLSTSNGTSDQARRAVLNFIGGASINRDVICPAVNKTYLVRNASTDTLSFRRGGGSVVVTVRPGRSEVLFSSAGDFYAITSNTYFPNITGQVNATHGELNNVVGSTSNIQQQLNLLNAAIGGTTGDLGQLITQINSRVAKAGDTMTGPLNLSGSPTQNLHAATKQYVDVNLASKQNALGYTPLNRAGDTMAGPLVVQNPTQTNHAATRGYVDSGLNAKQNTLGYTPLNQAGGTMSGALGVQTPTQPTHAARKDYVDAGLATKRNTGPISAFRYTNSTVRTSAGAFSGFSGSVAGGGGNAAGGQFTTQRTGWYILTLDAEYTSVANGQYSRVSIEDATGGFPLATVDIYASAAGQPWRNSVSVVVSVSISRVLRCVLDSTSGGSIRAVSFAGSLLE